MGCRVCGAGIDYSWGPGWVAIQPGMLLIDTVYQTGWEYLCSDCHAWARQLGVLWDGKFTFTFEGFKVPDYTARMAYGQRQINVPGRVRSYCLRGGAL